jgi:hypothetical protein
LQGAQQRSTRWRGRSFSVSMTSPSSTFGGESSAFDSYLPYHNVFLVMQIGPRASYQHTARAFLDRRPCGQTENTTAIAPYPRRSLQK